jgi:hypothetical protein
MRPETQAIVVKALDQALATCIEEGFKSFLTRPDAGRNEAFLRGLNIAVGLHEQFVGVFAEEITDGTQERDGADRPEDVRPADEAEAFVSKGRSGQY